MSNGVVGLLMGLGVGAWVYNKIYRSSGGNNKSALIVAGIAGVFSFAIMVMLLSFFFKQQSTLGLAI